MCFPTRLHLSVLGLSPMCFPLIPPTRIFWSFPGCPVAFPTWTGPLRMSWKWKLPFLGRASLRLPEGQGRDVGLGLTWTRSGVGFADPWDPSSGDSLILVESREPKLLKGEVLAKWWQGIYGMCTHWKTVNISGKRKGLCMRDMRRSCRCCWMGCDHWISG